MKIETKFGLGEIVLTHQKRLQDVRRRQALAGDREIAELLAGRAILAGSHRRWMRLERLAKALRARLGL